MKVGVYYRVSSELQDHSLKMQEHMGLKAAVANNLVIEKIYDEDVCSARKVPLKQRPRLSALLRDIQSGEITHLIVYKRDRLARKSHEYMQIYQVFKEYNVTVIFSADNEFPIRYDAMGEYVELIMSGLVEREGDLINKRIRDTKIANFLEGTLVGPLPYGYDLAEDKDSKERIIPNSGQLDVVREIFAFILAGKTPREIMKIFRERGYTRTYESDTKHHKKGEKREWKVADIETILKSTLYYGTATMNISGLDEPLMFSRPEAKIIEKRDWLKVQERLKELAPEADDDEEEKEPITFCAEGLVYCGRCHEPMTTKTRRPNYTPTGYYECGSDGIRVPAKALEERLLQRAESHFRVLLDGHLVNLVKRHQDESERKLRQRLNQTEEHLREVQRQMVKAAGMYLKSDKDSARKKRIKRMVEHYDTLESSHHTSMRIQAQRERLAEMLEMPKALHEQILLQLAEKVREPEALTALFRDIIARVDVHPEGIDITLKHPFLTTMEVMDDVIA